MLETEKQSSSKLKAIDFFCGAGGMTYGLRQAGINVLAGIDNDETCKKTYEDNNPKSKFLPYDIHDLSVEQLIEETGIKMKDNSLIFIGCSPCQYWTKINTNKKKSKKSKDLLGEFQRFVAYFKPGYIVIENVPGLYKKMKKNALSPFLQFLDDEEYHYDHGLVNANLLGVPQHRIRYLLIGSRISKDIKLPLEEENDELILKNFIGRRNGFHKVKAGHKDNSEFMHTVADLSEKNMIRIKLTPKNGGNRMSWKSNPYLQLEAYKGKDHIFKDVYGRMFWNKPAPTITTRFNSLSNGRFGHPEEDRAISLREGAILQSFPKSYDFQATNVATIARHIGNAVPPEMARRIGNQIMEGWKNAIIPNKS